MSDETPPPAPQPKPIDIAADQVNIGGDVVGRDKIVSVGDDLIQGNVTQITQVGMSPDAVRKLVITVGALVAVTAALFFVGGILIGGAAIAALNRPVDSSAVAAREFQNGLAVIADLPSGQPFRATFTEEQLSSYLRFVLGPQIGLSNGRARLLRNGQVVFYGAWDGLLGLPIMVTCTAPPDSPDLFVINSVQVQILPFSLFNPTEVSNLGWLPLPNFAGQPLVDRINADIGQYFILTGIISGGGGGASGGDDGDLLTVFAGIRK